MQHASAGGQLKEVPFYCRSAAVHAAIWVACVPSVQHGDLRPRTRSQSPESRLSGPGLLGADVGSLLHLLVCHQRRQVLA